MLARSHSVPCVPHYPLNPTPYTLKPYSGCIQVSETTCDLLTPRHTFEGRGGVEVKGKVRTAVLG